MKVLVLNGPNLGRLDIRDSSIYGDMSYPNLVSHIEIAAKSHGFEADVRQSNDEAEIIFALINFINKKKGQQISLAK